MNEISLPDGFGNLPSDPRIVDRILRLLPLEEESASPVWDSVRWDPALAARILAAADATRWDEAKSKLDDFTLRMTALQFSLPNFASELEDTRLLYETFWRRCRIVAAAAELLWMEKPAPPETDVDLFLAGLLGDFHRLILIDRSPVESRQIFETVLNTARPWAEVEREPIETDNRPNPAANEGQAPTAVWDVLAVAAALGDFIVWSELSPKHSEIWKERLKQEYTNRIADVPDVEDRLETLTQTTQRRLSELVPAAFETERTNAERWTLANCELARLGFEVHSRARKSEASLEKLEQRIHRLEWHMIRDSLTGVYNRRFLLESLEKEAARCLRYGEPMGLLFVDVDEFKPLNDTWGHLVGDAVLRQVAEVLGRTLRAADILARFGGEEFVILANKPFKAGLVQLAERLRTAVEAMQVETNLGPVSVTVSVGCALAVPSQDETQLGQQLLAAADAAMYEAKQLGRNRAVFRSMLNEARPQKS